MCLAISKDDGKTWTKPDFGVGFNGTNAVWSPGSRFYFGSVLYEAEAEDSMRFKMVFWDIQASVTNASISVPGMYTACSADGINWSQLHPQGEPSLLGAYGDPNSQPPKSSMHPDRRPTGSGGAILTPF